MDVVKLLQSLEEAIFEIVTWVLFAPKTFFKVLIRPDWVLSYVSGELEKEPAKRFQGYVSPLLFWVIIAVLPYTVASVKVDTNGSILTVGDLNSSVLKVSSAALITIPVFSAWCLLILKKLPFEREPLKRLLYAQCYPAAILEFFAFPLLALVALPKGSVSPELFTVIQWIITISGLWYLVAETFLFKQELGISWLGAAWRASFMTLLSTFLLAVVITVITLYFVAIGTIQPPSS